MNARFILLLAASVWLSGQTLRAEDASTDNPYAPIVTRNVFGLVPIPVHNPADDVPAVPPPKITPNGIMTLFGKLQVLFKVAGVARPGQPPKDESYVMCEGDRQDEIEVKKIDEKNATITFNNHGVVQELPLVAGTASGGDAAPSPGFVPPPVMGGAPGIAPRVGGVGFGGRFGRNRNLPPPSNPNVSSGGAPGFGGNPAIPQNNVQPQQEVTPEAQIIMMEAQREQFKQEGHPAAIIIPPTPLTQQLNGEDGGGGPPAPGQ